MEVDTETVAGMSLHENPSGGLDSDDETLRFDKDDDLYAEDLDEEDARWVRKQHRPTSEWEEEAKDAPPPTGGKNIIGKGEAMNDDNGIDQDEIADDQPPTISDTSIGDGGSPAGAQEKQREVRRNNQQGKMDVASDAQLSCPLCFTTVCLECQRHAKYYNQFRAVTGINVNVNFDVFLTLDDVSGGGGSGSRRRKGRRKGDGKTAAAASVARDGGGGLDRRDQTAHVDAEDREEEQETFHPVSCGECDHRVGVYDVDEVFHFFGVVASG